MDNVHIGAGTVFLSASATPAGENCVNTTKTKYALTPFTNQLIIHSKAHQKWNCNMSLFWAGDEIKEPRKSLMSL